MSSDENKIRKVSVRGPMKPRRSCPPVSVVDNIKEIITLVLALNIANHPELAKTCEQMRKALTHILLPTSLQTMSA